MDAKKKVVIGLSALGAVAMLPGVAVGQQQTPSASETVALDSILSGATITLRVDGMVCPFCAYGLEKRLRKIAAVDSVIVRVSDGMVQIRERGEQRVSNASLQEAVTRAGFTLKDIQRIGSK